MIPLYYTEVRDISCSIASTRVYCSTCTSDNGITYVLGICVQAAQDRIYCSSLAHTPFDPRKLQYTYMRVVAVSNAQHRRAFGRYSMGRGGAALTYFRPANPCVRYTRAIRSSCRDVKTRRPGSGEEDVRPAGGDMFSHARKHRAHGYHCCCSWVLLKCDNRWTTSGCRLVAQWSSCLSSLNSCRRTPVVFFCRNIHTIKELCVCTRVHTCTLC